jgi:hypothetical protein
MSGYQMTGAMGALDGQVFEVGYNGANVELRVGGHVLALDEAKRELFRRDFLTACKQAALATATQAGDPWKVIGANLLALRKERGWPLRVLVAKSGVSLNSCHRAEHGFPVTLANVVRLAAAFGVTVDDLLRGAA